jgi:hypothetical protein
MARLLATRAGCSEKGDGPHEWKSPDFHAPSMTIVALVQFRSRPDRDRPTPKRESGVLCGHSGAFGAVLGLSQPKPWSTSRRLGKNLCSQVHNRLVTKWPVGGFVAVLILCASACSDGSGTHASATTTSISATTHRSDVGQVEGTVVSVSLLSGPVTGAEVQALDEGRHVVATAKTNSRGRFTMKLQGGRYAFDVVTHVGCVFRRVLASVTEGHRTTVELRCDVP